jgi:hypothetical protein
LDAVTPITGVHLGIEYRGEVVRVERWSASLGKEPGQGAHFKIVLLQDRPKLGLPNISDPKVAVCVPSSRPGRHAHRIIGEITAAKQAAYLTRRDVDAAAINSALRQRQDNLESQLISEESERFSKGDILVHEGRGPDLAVIYTGSEPMQWTEELAAWILARCYPSLPLPTGAVPGLICEDDIASIFASIFGQGGVGPDLLRTFGPALGLSKPEASGSYDPSDCPVFPLIRAKIGGGQANFEAVHRYLAYEVRLTGQLASLFLLLFLHQELPEHQIQLRDEAAMSLTGGAPLLSARLTPDLVPLIDWNDDLASSAASIGPATTPGFADVRHHLWVLCPEIAKGGEDSADDALAECFRSITEEMAAARRVLDLLKSAETGHDLSAETVSLNSALERLSNLSGGNYADVYQSIRAVYPALPDLTDDLETLRQLSSLDEDSAEIFQAQTYIANAQPPTEGFANLAVDRETLLTGLSASRLARSGGRGWGAIARDAAAFKARYAQAYREHHQKFHDSLPGYQSMLETATKKSAALDLLNTIVELEVPEGTGLREELEALAVGPEPCSHQESHLDLSKEPHCPECQISLALNVPSAELARLAPQVDMALAGKTRELSKRLVEKALAGRTDERWQEFLQIVQASELSSLANTLDNDLVAFIKQVLD